MIMRLFGLYAIYQNQEFELVEHSESRWKIPGDTEYWLLTDNPGAAALGFGTWNSLQLRRGGNIQSDQAGLEGTLHTDWARNAPISLQVRPLSSAGRSQYSVPPWPVTANNRPQFLHRRILISRFRHSRRW